MAKLNEDEYRRQFGMQEGIFDAIRTYKGEDEKYLELVDMVGEMDACGIFE